MGNDLNTVAAIYLDGECGTFAAKLFFHVLHNLYIPECTSRLLFHSMAMNFEISIDIEPVYRHVLTCKIEDSKALIYRSPQPIGI